MKIAPSAEKEIQKDKDMLDKMKFLFRKKQVEKAKEKQLLLPWWKFWTVLIATYICFGRYPTLKTYNKD